MMNLRLDTHATGEENAVYEFVVDDDETRTFFPVSSVRLFRINDEHTRIKFWNRGRGTMNDWAIVQTRDALLITARLFGLSLSEFARVLTDSLRRDFR